MEHKKLHVIVVISNPVQFESRYRLYHEFMEEMSRSNAIFHTVELVLGERQHTIPPSPFNTLLRVHGWDEVWHKENLINLGLSRLPNDAEYVAWIDADVSFQYSKKWVTKTLHALQHYMVVQMFENAVDMGPNGQVIQLHTGFVKQYLDNGSSVANYRPGYSPHWHPGFAWAARREALECSGGLIDKAILGAGDHHMALALVGAAEKSLQAGLTDGYRRMVLTWQERAERFIRRDVGFVRGTILHSWHGKKKDRRYTDRWKILVKNKFNPDYDLKRDTQGVYHLNDDGSQRFVMLRDEIRAYFRARNEDSIDLE